MAADEGDRGLATDASATAKPGLRTSGQEFMGEVPQRLAEATGNTSTEDLDSD